MEQHIVDIDEVDGQVVAQEHTVVQVDAERADSPAAPSAPPPDAPAGVRVFEASASPDSDVAAATAVPVLPILATAVSGDSTPQPRPPPPSPAPPAAHNAPEFPIFGLRLILARVMGRHGEPSLVVPCPCVVKVLLSFFVIVSAMWILHFCALVLPARGAHIQSLCGANEGQLKQTAVVLIAYFLCFAIIRSSLFLPGIAAHVADIQTGGQGLCKIFAVHLILHVPLYIFGMGFAVFVFQLYFSPDCGLEAAGPDPRETANTPLRNALQPFAVHTFLVLGLSVYGANVHSRIMCQAYLLLLANKSRRAPDGTLEKLRLVPYNPDTFGDEEGKAYASECPICLEEYGPGDQIRVTPCGHAFHSACIGSWLNTERTCAFCRQDLTQPVSREVGTPSPAAQYGASAMPRPAETGAAATPPVEAPAGNRGEGLEDGLSGPGAGANNEQRETQREEQAEESPVEEVREGQLGQEQPPQSSPS